MTSEGKSLIAYINLPSVNISSIQYLSDLLLERRN